MTFSEKVVPDENTSNKTSSSNPAEQAEDWGPFSVPGISRRRSIPEQYGDTCIFAYDIALTGWKFLEIIKKDDEHFLVYWGENPTPEKIRKITPREVAYVPKTETHLNNIFKGLSDMVGLSTSASKRAESDRTFLADELDRLIEFHKKMDRITGAILPRFLMNRQEEGILFLKERVFDLVEFLMLNRAMGDHLKESIKP